MPSAARVRCGFRTGRRLEGGVSLIQLVVILAVIGVLAALAVPAYRDYRIRAYLAEAREIALSWRTAAVGYWHARGSFAGATDLTVAWTNPPSRVWVYGGHVYGRSPWREEAWFVANLRPEVALSVGLSPYQWVGDPDYMYISPVWGAAMECGRLLRRPCPDGRFPGDSQARLPGTPVASVPPETVTDSSFTVFWTDVDGEDRYRVEWRVSGAAGWPDSRVLAAGTTSYAVTGLRPDTTYEVRVVAGNSAGESASNVVSVTTDPLLGPPPPPEDLRLGSATSTSLTVVWTDVASNEDGYLVEYRQAGAQTWVPAGGALPPGSQSATVSGLDPATSLYEVRVAAFNQAGQSPWVAVTVSTTGQGPPAPPGALRVMQVTSRSVLVGWHGNAAGASYEAQYRPAGGSTWTPLGTASEPTMAMAVNLNPATNYEFRVRSVRSVGASNVYSEWVQIPFSTPAYQQAGCSPSIEIEWRTTRTISGRWQDCPDETRYRVSISDGNGSEVAYRFLGRNTTRWSFTGLQAPASYSGEVPYTFSVCAEGEVGAAARCSSERTGTRHLAQYRPAPQTPSVTLMGGEYAWIRWNDSDRETHYVLEARALSGGAQSLTRQIVADAREYVIRLSPNSRYGIYLQTCNGFGCNVGQGVTLQTGQASSGGSGVPSSPGPLNVTDTGGASVRLSWSDVQGESGYRIRYRKAGETSWALAAQVAAGVTRYVLFLAPVTEYEFQVTAYTSSGESAPAVASFTTGPVLAALPASPPSPSVLELTSRGVLTVTWSPDLVFGATSRVEILNGQGTVIQGVTLEAGASRYSFALDRSGSHTVRVRWYNNTGQTEWGAVPLQVSLLTPPSLNLRIAERGARWALFVWDDPLEFERGYWVEILNTSGGLVSSFVLGRNGTMALIRADQTRQVCVSDGDWPEARECVLFVPQ